MTTPTHETIAREAAEKIDSHPWPKNQIEAIILNAITRIEAPLLDHIPENVQTAVTVLRDYADEKGMNNWVIGPVAERKWLERTQSDLAAAQKRIAELESKPILNDVAKDLMWHWKSQYDTALVIQQRAEAERDSLRAQLATAQAELSDIKTILANPQAVYLNLMHGKIATPTAEQLRDVAGGGDYVTVQPLLAELESLRADKARLDWLNTENCEGWLITTKPKHYRAINYTDIRLAVDAAIDAARTEANP